MIRRPTLLAFLLLTSGCWGDSPTDSPRAFDASRLERQYPIRAIATVGMVADIVRHVGGTHVEVKQMMGAGVDPHLYKPTRDDVQMIMEGEIIFYGGLMLEGKMTDTLVKIARAKPVVAVTEQLDEDWLLEPATLQGHYDPHVWMDVAAWGECVQVVTKALAELDPRHAAEYRDQAAAYRAKLDELDQYGRQAIGSIPEQSRVLITSHDAFNYLGRAYGLNVQGIQGISTESEAGLQRVSNLVQLLVERNVQAVFIESSVPRKSIDALIEGARAQGHEVHVGGELYSDAMGNEGTYEGTYVGMLDHNFTIIPRALGGTAPELGFQGKLQP